MSENPHPEPPLKAIWQAGNWAHEEGLAVDQAPDRPIADSHGKKTWTQVYRNVWRAGWLAYHPPP